ncbi:hypothetical protein IW261DRAFT_1511090 [Armillaria novae-zelandiae]|uniref:Uncharacterized protein n=1 Tax=Armillaria novae-zelandiae TaxID=153914 RepID=A0AA39NTQ3_9AGAR|nr:hypothetical protein IW261DRAFT_1511090 [Armillaria novae-zelandiae]
MSLIRKLPINHALLGYVTTASNPVGTYNPQAIAFPPHAAIAEHYRHPFHIFHDASSSVRFNSFADEGPDVEQSPSKVQPYSENMNTGRPVFTNPFSNSNNILSDAILGLAPYERIRFSPQRQYTANTTEHAYTIAHFNQVQNYTDISHTNAGDSRSRSSSRTFVDDRAPAPRTFYWVDRFNKLRKIGVF